MKRFWVIFVLALAFLEEHALCFSTRFLFLPAFSLRHNKNGVLSSTDPKVEPDVEAFLDPKVEPDVEAFLEGKPRKWSGRWDIMKRRGQMPAPEQSPVEVVVTILKALKTNDDPQIDHGAAVVLAFASPDGPLKRSGLDPAQYGSFLRTNYPALLDFKSAELLGDTKLIDITTTTFRQPIRARGWSGDSSLTGDFEFILTRSGENDPWLIDVIKAAKP